MKQDFLNKKEVPTHQQILNFFFSTSEINEMMESLEYSMDNSSNDINSLGEPDEVETVKGTEWEISRVTWNMDDGPRCLIYLKKIGVDISNINLDFNMNTTNNDLFFNSFFNYNNIDNFDNVDNIDNMTPIVFQELLDEAINSEDFEEAVRLRDWNKGLLELLAELKPKIINAIDNSDLDALERYQNKINKYRGKL